LFLSPGDSEAVAGLEELVQADVPLLKIITPQSGERFFIIPGAPPRRLRAAREDAEEAQGPDWQNDYASFVANLKHEMANLPTDKDRRRALAEMRAILVQGEGQDGSGAPD